jgi:phenylalanine ammonia-lyase
LSIQALQGTNQSFHPFIHQRKPHPGQLWTAEKMLQLLDGSQMSRDELDGRHEYRGEELIQDRYSMRCLAQFIGPVVEGLQEITRKVEIEINSATDNPLIDYEHQATYHGGNFLGEYIGVTMDQLRYYIGLLAKHMDTQLSLMIAPQFNSGLPACLIGNPERRVNMGLKGLQIAANSIMPLLTYYGQPIADRFPTHAEQFNQNINSQGFNSANLARRSVDVFRDYTAMALMFVVQGVDLRTKLLCGHYDARRLLSPASAALYEAVRSVVQTPPSMQRPFIWDDNEQALDQYIQRIVADIAAEGKIPAAVAWLTNELKQK